MKVAVAKNLYIRFYSGATTLVRRSTFVLSYMMRRETLGQRVEARCIDHTSCVSYAKIISVLHQVAVIDKHIEVKLVEA
eukprot:scaffold2003_cov139-Cylindrotheca_fusiformis.AAC.9